MNSVKEKAEEMHLSAQYQFRTLQIFNSLQNILLLNENEYNTILSSSQQEEFMLQATAYYDRNYQFLKELNINDKLQKLFNDHTIFPNYQIQYGDLIESNNEKIPIIFELDDLIAQMMKDIHQIETTPKIELSQTTSSVQFLSKFLLADIFDIFQLLKSKLSGQIQDILSLISTSIYAFLGVELGLFMFGLVFLWQQISKIKESFSSVLEILSEIQNYHVQSVKKYFIDLYQDFREFQQEHILNEKESMTSRLTADLDNIDYQVDENLYHIEMQQKRMKEVNHGNFLQSLQRTIIINFMIFILLICSINVIFFFDVRSLTQAVQNFNESGRDVLQLAVKDIFLMAAVKERYLSNNDLENIQTKIQEFLLTDSMAMSTKMDSTFLDILSQMYYENPCIMIKNEDVNETIGITVENCEAVNLNVGLKPFDTQFINKISNYVKSETDYKNGISQETIYEINQGVKFVTYFLEIVLKQWNYDLNQKISDSIKS